MSYGTSDVSSKLAVTGKREWPPCSHMHQLNAIAGVDNAVLPVYSSIH